MAKVIAILGTDDVYFSVSLTIEGGRSIPRLVIAYPEDVEAAKQSFDLILVTPSFVGRSFEICDDPAFPRSATPGPSCPVELCGEGLPAKVGDLELPTAAGSAYRALAYLVKVFPAGVKRATLNEIAGVKDISGALGDLLRRDGRWAKVLRFPRRQGEVRGPAGVYSIAPLWRELSGVIVVPPDAPDAA
jgi:hypothetical protein